MQAAFKPWMAMTRVAKFHNHNLLKQRLREVIPEKQALLKEIRKKYGNKEICKVTVDQAIGGMRNVFALFYDASLLDAKTVRLLLARESHSETTRFPKFKSICRRHPKATSLCQRLFTGSYALESFLVRY